jgi:hypothetical protein
MTVTVLPSHNPATRQFVQSRAMLGREASSPAGLTARAVAIDEWDAAVAGFDGICQEQTVTFSRLRWPSLACEPRLFASGGEIVGGCLVMIQQLPLKLAAVAICKWGPMLKDSRRSDRATIYRGMIEALVAEYAGQRGLMLSVLPRAAPTGTGGELATLAALGFTAGSNVPFPDRYLVNLQIPDAAQRASLHQKWRYHLKRSERAELTFEHATADRLPEFARLYEAMSARKRFPDYSAYATVPGLFAASDPALRPELFFVRHRRAIVAGAIIFKSGDTAVYLYGATTNDALPLRAGYFLHWHIIRWLRDNTRARWYDLGGTDGFLGLHQFKKGIVGEAGVIVSLPPMANYAAHAWPRLIGSGAFAARDFVLNLRYRLQSRWSNQAKPDQPRAAGGS